MSLQQRQAIDLRETPYLFTCRVMRAGGDIRYDSEIYGSVPMFARPRPCWGHFGRAGWQRWLLRSGDGPKVAEGGANAK